ncbi:Hypothetical_protein [Hexamita inflata]|uniref:Hypothetical_protein n=1 Tax=Hexamita inflata TaxID=28002 RepID=A0AA86PEG7_9EUKA|nr:Hypothetical protein HINF_LOCUS22104 [Hexamita inflata]
MKAIIAQDSVIDKSILTNSLTNSTSSDQLYSAAEVQATTAIQKFYQKVKLYTKTISMCKFKKQISTLQHILKFRHSLKTKPTLLQQLDSNIRIIIKSKAPITQIQSIQRVYLAFSLNPKIIKQKLQHSSSDLQNSGSNLYFALFSTVSQFIQRKPTKQHLQFSLNLMKCVSLLLKNSNVGEIQKIGLQLIPENLVTQIQGKRQRLDKQFIANLKAGSNYLVLNGINSANLVQREIINLIKNQ